MELDQQILTAHRQIYQTSCVPMSVELVLKLVGAMGPTDFRLQNQTGGASDLTLARYDGVCISGVTFRRRFGESRGADFPLDRLFDTIATEVTSGRYVIASLASPGGNWHMHVVYAHAPPTGEFSAATKAYPYGNLHADDVRQRITLMQGTDILTCSQ